MIDFEKLGAFYIGRRVDADSDVRTDEPVLYDASDLTTHAVIIGMTGSGKTGLGIGLLEEAALDHVPVIAIDPKGDLGNLLLTFPALEPDDFRPWVDERLAMDRGIPVETFAEEQAALWKKGLEEWGQSGERIRQLRAGADFAIYTPGSNAGEPVSVLRSFAAPPQAVIDDAELYRDYVQVTATGVLSLAGVESDPATGREHILLSRILDDAWQRGRSLDLPSLIDAIQNPPFEQVGVMKLDSVFPKKERFELAVRINNLLASPGFDAWLEGEPLDVAGLLHTASGQPRISILSIAHLNDADRMFFLSMLLNELISWMRTQPGTPTLRAILYMDEIQGYMPPVANPPTKRLLLTLLKQARAYGLGLVLATQNPVDLDYKGLSNAGTWFIGRLQTERDKARVMEGLEGAAQGGNFDRRAMEQTLAGLNKRHFLMHNVHEDHPVVFETRWAMSYLAGPMTRDQIHRLCEGRRAAGPSTTPAESQAASARTNVLRQPAAGTRPVLPPGIRQRHLDCSEDDIVYYPRVFAVAEVAFSSSRYDVDENRRHFYTLELDEDTATADWEGAETMAVPDGALKELGRPEAAYAECPAAAAREESYKRWQGELKRWLRQNERVELFTSKQYRLTSAAGEGEGAFRARLQLAAREKRDQKVAAIRKRFASRATTLERRLSRAEQAVDREAEQSTKSRVDTAVSFGTAILGAVLGRKRLSSTTASRVGSAIRSAGSARKQAADVTHAREAAAEVRGDIEKLDAELKAEIDAMDATFDARQAELETVAVKPKTTDIHVSLIGLLWMPYRHDADGPLEPAWQNGGGATPA